MPTPEELKAQLEDARAALDEATAKAQKAESLEQKLADLESQMSEKAGADVDYWKKKVEEREQWARDEVKRAAEARDKAKEEKKALLEAMQAKEAEREAQRVEMARKEALDKALADTGIEGPYKDLALKVIDTASFEIGDDGTVSGVSKAVGEFNEQYPGLANKKGGSLKMRVADKGNKDSVVDASGRVDSKLVMNRSMSAWMKKLRGEG